MQCIMKTFWLYLSCILIISACSKDTIKLSEPPTAPTTPTSPIPKVDLDISEITVSAESSKSKTIKFTASAPWTIAVSTTRSTPDWFNVTPRSGEAGEAEITISIIKENEEYDDRNAYIHIHSDSIKKSITITQKKKNALLLTKDRYDVLPTGGIFSVEVCSNVLYEVTIPYEYREWIKKMPKSRGLTTSYESFAVLAGTIEGNREGFIVFSSGILKDTVHIYQAQENSLVLSEKEKKIDSNAQFFNVEIKTNVDYEIAFADNWLRESLNRATRVNRIQFSVDENTSGKNRITKVVFKDKNSILADTLTIIQYAQTPQIEEGIFTAEDLWILANELNKNIKDESVLARFGTKVGERWIFILKDNINLNPEIKFNADGTYTGGTPKSWEPIGNANSLGGNGNSFSDTFDGNGYRIDGVYINTQKEVQGLFGYLSSPAIIKNLTIGSGSITGMNYVGSLVGIGTLSRIENCKSYCNVTGYSYVGGLTGYIGYTENSIFYGKVIGNNIIGGISGTNNKQIINCINNGKIVLKGSDIKENIGTGGICGVNYGTISKSLNYGSIEYTSSYLGYQENMGGICGLNFNGIIEECNNHAAIDCGNGDQLEMFNGGICGFNKGGAIRRCNNLNEIISRDFDLSGTGGICGKNDSKGSLSECNNQGTITGRSNIGGICGQNDNEIVNCQNNSPIYCNENTYTKIGGICGTNKNGKIVLCINKAEVSGTGYNDKEVGGICGYSNAGKIIQSSNTGQISNEYNVGGICGLTSGTAINECINKGNVSGASRIGGIVGEANLCTTILESVNNGKISANYCTNIGGIIGEMSGYSTNQSFIIGCSNNGEISVTGINAQCNVGGILGYSYKSGFITVCYNTGILSINSDKAYIGGIAGNFFLDSESSFQSVYNSGTINIGTGYNPSLKGGIIGKLQKSGGSFSNFYWLNDCGANVPFGTDSSGVASGKLDAESLKNISNTLNNPTTSYGYEFYDRQDNYPGIRRK